jgi:hypothetical protein
MECEALASLYYPQACLRECTGKPVAMKAVASHRTPKTSGTETGRYHKIQAHSGK